MNQSQRKYGANRLDTIASKKIAKIIDKHTTPEVRLDIKEKLKAIKSNKYKILSHSRRPYSYNDIESYLVFTEEKEKVVNQKAIDAERKRINAEVQRIKDELYLGDAEQAMKLLAAFEKFK